MKNWNEITVMLKMTKEDAITQLSQCGYQPEITYQIQDEYYLPKSSNLHENILTLLNDMILIR